MQVVFIRSVFIGLLASIAGGLLVYGLTKDHSSETIIQEKTYVTYEESFRDMIKNVTPSLVHFSGIHGVVLTSDGLVVTLPEIDGDAIDAQQFEFPSSFVARHASLPLQIRQIDIPGGKQLVPARFVQAYSDVLVGERVIVLGNIKNSFEPIVKTTVLTSVGRKLQYDKSESVVFYTLDTLLDARFNGAGVFMIDGRLLGIIQSNAQLTRVVPLQNIKSILRSLESFGTIDEVKFDASYELIHDSMAEELTLPVSYGARLNESVLLQIEDGSNIRLNTDDIVLMADGIQIDFLHPIHSIFAHHIPGEMVEIHYIPTDVLTPLLPIKNMNDYINSIVETAIIQL